MKISEIVFGAEYAVDSTEPSTAYLNKDARWVALGTAKQLSFRDDASGTFDIVVDGVTHAVPRMLLKPKTQYGEGGATLVVFGRFLAHGAGPEDGVWQYRSARPKDVRVRWSDYEAACQRSAKAREVRESEAKVIVEKIRRYYGIEVIPCPDMWAKDGDGFSISEAYAAYSAAPEGYPGALNNRTLDDYAEWGQHQHADLLKALVWAYERFH